jgi:hypothetical protein
MFYLHFHFHLFLFRLFFGLVYFLSLLSLLPIILTSFLEKRWLSQFRLFGLLHAKEPFHTQTISLNLFFWLHFSLARLFPFTLSRTPKLFLLHLVIFDLLEQLPPRLWRNPRRRLV